MEAWSLPLLVKLMIGSFSLMQTFSRRNNKYAIREYRRVKLRKFLRKLQQIRLRHNPIQDKLYILVSLDRPRSILVHSP